MDMGSLSASVTELAGEIGAAVEAVLLVRVAVGRGPGPGLDGPGDHGARRSITDRFEIRHPLPPRADIMPRDKRVLAMTA
jgi:hypothetical protein